MYRMDGGMVWHGSVCYGVAGGNVRVTISNV